MFLLDTVAVSEFEKPRMDPGFESFLEQEPSKSLYVSVVTLGELTYGLQRMPLGRRRNEIEAWFKRTEDHFAGRVLPVDDATAKIWGAIRVGVQRSGFTIVFDDLLIAATAIRHDLTVVTRNARDFEPTGCKIINPWEQQI